MRNNSPDFIPFSLLRRAYQHAIDTQNDNCECPETVQDYWPECLRIAIERYLERREGM